MTKLNGRAMMNSSQFRTAIASTKPNEIAALEVFRNGKTQTIKVKIGLLDDKVTVTSNGDASSSTDFGLTVQTLTPQTAEELGYSSGQKGVVVTDVDPTGIAASVGLSPKDVIVTVNDEKITDAESFRQALTKYDIKEGLRLQVKTGGFSRFIFLKTR